mgnify:CR=1 FL=1
MEDSLARNVGDPPPARAPRRSNRAPDSEIVSFARRQAGTPPVGSGEMALDWTQYDSGGFFDELISSPGHARAPARRLVSCLAALSDAEIEARRRMAEATIRQLGVTFTVYSEEGNIDRAWPFDIIPRTIAARQWREVEAGLKQRLRALNRFIDDVYHGQRIVADGVFPAAVLAQSKNFRPECVGVSPPFGVWANICGTDLVRDERGRFFVLEDNLRVPSGVAYMLENRAITKRVLPELFENEAILPVNDYPARLFDTLAALSPRKVRNPGIVVLTPGIYNSAYFEHAFLAQQMGVELVEGQDLFVRDEHLYMRTTQGPQRVDVIYRRIDDDFLDPLAFRADSMLGVPGLLQVYRAGHVTLANAIGTGVADDKSIYPYVPDMIRFYLGEEPLLNNVPTYMCRKKEDLAYVLAHLDELVVKEVHGAGGYGMLIGPRASKEEIARFRQLLTDHPEGYIAQPTLSLSACPTFVEQGIAPRHIDLRPFVLSGKDINMVPGGLTRVALREGSLVVNSSQGGGTKDTWVLEV